LTSRQSSHGTIFSRERDEMTWIDAALGELPRRRPLVRAPVQSAVVRRVLFGASFLTLLGISLALRLRGLDAHFWVDEGLAVGIASHPLAHIPGLLAQDGSPPLYYVLLHLWIGVAGHGERTTHELSLLFALLTIPAALWAGTSLFGVRAGWIAAALAAFDPFVTAYGQETRMYSLVVLLSLVTAAAFVHAFVRRRRRYLPLFAGALALTLYTHNWGLYLGAMSAAAFLFLLRQSEDRRALVREGACAFGAVALLYAPWLPTLAGQVLHTGAPWAAPPVLWDLSRGGYAVAGGRGAAIGLLLAVGAGLSAVWGQRERHERSTLVALLLLGPGVLLLAWTTAKLFPGWAERYLAVAVGPVLVLAAFGLQRAGRLGMVALALVLSFWILDPVDTTADRKSNVAAIAAQVRHRLAPGDLVLSSQPEQVPVLRYYLGPHVRFGTPLGAVPDTQVMDWRDAVARMQRESTRTTLLPLVARAQPGSHVLLVVPIWHQRDAPWARLVIARSKQWQRALRSDPRLVLVRDLRRGVDSAGVPVRALLFRAI